jgi:hypothetical protein
LDRNPSGKGALSAGPLGDLPTKLAGVIEALVFVSFGLALAITQG